MNLDSFFSELPVSNSACFAGRQHEVRRVCSRLANMECSSIVGERGFGKTSFMNYISDGGTLSRYGLDPRKYSFVRIDFQSHDHPSAPESFWDAFQAGIDRQLEINGQRDAFPSFGQPAFLRMQVLGERLDRIHLQGQKVVLLLDAFDRITMNPQFTPHFLNNLRFLAIHHNLALITSSRRDLAEICHSTKVDDSPLFNIFAVVRLGLLTLTESMQLIDQSLAGTSISFDEQERRYLLETSGGHPFLLQVLGHSLCESFDQQLPTDERLAVAGREAIRAAAPIFREYWSDSTDDERTLLRALATADLQRDDRIRPVIVTAGGWPDRARHQLQDRAMLRRAESRDELFSPLFGKWILDEIVRKRPRDGTDRK